jgi:hypothetical protein
MIFPYVPPIFGSVSIRSMPRSEDWQKFVDTGACRLGNLGLIIQIRWRKSTHGEMGSPKFWFSVQISWNVDALYGELSETTISEKWMDMFCFPSSDFEIRLGGL